MNTDNQTINKENLIEKFNITTSEQIEEDAIVERIIYKFLELPYAKSLSDFIIYLIESGHTNFNSGLLKLQLTKLSELYLKFAEMSIKNAKRGVTTLNTSLNKVQNFKNWIDTSYTREVKKLSETCKDVKEYSSNKYTELRKWIDNSYFKAPLSIPFILGEKTILFANSTQLLVFDHIYSPIKGLTITYGGGAINFLIEKSDKLIENSLYLLNQIKDKATTLFSNSKEFLINGKESLFQFNNTEQYLVFSINNTLLYFPYKSAEMVNFVVQSVNKIEFTDLKNQTLSVYNSTRNKVESTTCNVLHKYKTFLGSEKSNDGKGSVIEKDEKEDIRGLLNDCVTDTLRKIKLF